MDEQMVDLDAIQDDDALLDKIGAGETPKGREGDPVVPVLVGWRREVVDTPVRELIDPVTAVRLVKAHRRASRRQWWRDLARRVTFGRWPR